MLSSEEILALFTFTGTGLKRSERLSFARAVEAAVVQQVTQDMQEPMTCGHVTANWQRDDTGHECCLGCVEKQDVERAVLRRVQETVEETKSRRPGDSHSGRRYGVTAGEGYLLACNDIIRKLTAEEP